MSKETLYYPTILFVVVVVVLTEARVLPAVVVAFNQSYGFHALFPYVFTASMLVWSLRFSDNDISATDFLRLTIYIGIFMLIVTSIFEGLQVWIPENQFDWWDMSLHPVGIGVATTYFYRTFRPKAVSA